MDSKEGIVGLESEWFEVSPGYGMLSQPQFPICKMGLAQPGCERGQATMSCSITEMCQI